MFDFGTKQDNERRGFGVVDLLFENLSLLLVVGRIFVEETFHQYEPTVHDSIEYTFSITL